MKKDTDKNRPSESSKPPLFIDSVMCHFLFKYKCLDENYRVEIEAENLNKAMFNFATYYHQIQEVYSITEVS